MATNPLNQTNPGAALFDIYNDNLSAPAPDNYYPSLPTGACNFVDPNFGANGIRCGCRRFWVRSSLGAPVLDSPGWCMCNHHACFHDQGPHDAQFTDHGFRALAMGQENERPRTTREPLGQMVDLPHKIPSKEMGLDIPSFSVEDHLSFIYNDPMALGLSNQNPQDTTQPLTGSLPDTLGWDEGIQSKQQHQPQTARLTVAAQCVAPSQATSVASSVHAKYLRPFAGKGLHTLAGVKDRIPSSAPQWRPKLLEPTASRIAQDIEGSFVLVPRNQETAAMNRCDPGAQSEAQALSSENVSGEAFHNLTEIVGVHEQRLDQLETASFAGAQEECNEKHDHMDLRMTDLESRMEEVEKQTTDHAAVISRLSDKQDDASTQSIVSSSAPSDSTRPIHSHELYSQLQSLQEQVSSLQSALPPYMTGHAWEVEVVFLPFPLKRVWQEMHQFKAEVEVSGDDWTQLPMTYSAGATRSQSPFCGNWSTPDHDLGWLLPRACGDKSITDKRLRSRGLIRSISVKGPDARSVHTAMNAAFGEVWREMHLDVPDQNHDPRLSRFLGLQTAWVPLRKIHKDSRLRFLTPAEMVSPAMWDVQFLSSVMMRSTEPRLFITHPDAYVQDSEAYAAGWSWQEVREMKCVYPEASSSSEVAPEADTKDEHWVWNEQLDGPSGHQASRVLPRSGHGQHLPLSSSSQNIFASTRSLKSMSPITVSGQSSIFQHNLGRGPRLPHIRTTSTPVPAEVHNSPSLAKRRVASNGSSRRSSHSTKVTGQFAVVKKRRTRSPNHRFTPRWTASPSPMPRALDDRQPTRGTTPFTYATPHSNAPLNELRSVRGTSAVPVPSEYMVDSDRGDELYEIEIYESDSDESFMANDDDDNNNNGGGAAQVGLGSTLRQWQQLPEDAPWPGIEDHQRQRSFHDDENMENMDPEDIEIASNASSQPSEYPSTQRAWPAGGADFQIHEDDD